MQNANKTKVVVQATNSLEGNSTFFLHEFEQLVQELLSFSVRRQVVELRKCQMESDTLHNAEMQKQTNKEINICPCVSETFRYGTSQFVCYSCCCIQQLLIIQLNRH